MQINDLEVAYDVLADIKTDSQKSHQLPVFKSRAFDLLDGIIDNAKETRRQIELKGM